MPFILEKVNLRAGAFALKGLSMRIPKGKCVTLMGASGSGKTTLMETVCGLRKVAAGKIFLNGNNITQDRPGARSIGFVPQDTVLFPHLSVRQHLAFALTVQHWGKTDTTRRVDFLAETFELTELLDRYPHGLSGGEGKRVALARAIASRPVLLCLDESMTGLDRATHRVIITRLRELVREEKITTFHISHNENEANFFSDTIYLLEAGRITEKIRTSNSGSPC